MTEKLWPYDSDHHIMVEAGLEEQPTVDDVSERYLDWVSSHNYCFLKHDSGDVICVKSSKRGNDVYASKKSADYDLVGSALSDSVYSTIQDRKGFRSGVRYGALAQTYVLFVTYTYDTKLYTPFEAYKRCTSDLNRWKAYMTRELGMKYSSMCVKESTDKGYPAPHMIIILERPVTVVYWKGQKGNKWIVQDRTIIDHLHDAWERATEGTYQVDIQGVVGGSVGDGGTIAYYLSKYVGKSVKPSSKTSVYTLSLQKYFGLRDIISKAFWEALLVSRVKPQNRLDLIRNELKQLNKEIRKRERQSSDLAFVDCDLRALYKKRDDLRACIPPPEWVVIDKVTIYSPSGKVGDFAPVIDRIRLHSNNKQVYGTRSSYFSPAKTAQN